MVVACFVGSGRVLGRGGDVRNEIGAGLRFVRKHFFCRLDRHQVWSDDVDERIGPKILHIFVKNQFFTPTSMPESCGGSCGIETDRPRVV